MSLSLCGTPATVRPSSPATNARGCRQSCWTLTSSEQVKWFDIARMLPHPYAGFDKATIATTCTYCQHRCPQTKEGIPRWSGRAKGADLLMLQSSTESSSWTKNGKQVTQTSDRTKSALSLVKLMSVVLLYSYIPHGDPQDATQYPKQADWGKKKGQHLHELLQQCHRKS